MPSFVPGLEVSRAFHQDVVAPLVGEPHAAALLGAGSEVLGLDTARSTDHDWAPRCQVFVDEQRVEPLRLLLDERLPRTYAGWPLAAARDGGPAYHRVEVHTLGAWVDGELGWPAADRAPTTLDWLVSPQTRLAGITHGAVFADPDGSLGALRRRLAWYPDDVWWWLVACQWRRLAQEEPFVQRTAEVGDDLGSAVVTGRLVRDCLRLGLLLARRHAPYTKWLGTAAAALPDPEGLRPALAAAVTAASAGDREEALGRAYRVLGVRFNRLAGTEVDPSLRPFHDRPARVLGADRFTAAALARVGDPGLATTPLVGGVDQLLDSTDALTDPALTTRVRGYYLALGVPG